MPGSRTMPAIPGVAQWSLSLLTMKALTCHYVHSSHTGTHVPLPTLLLPMRVNFCCACIRLPKAKPQSTDGPDNTCALFPNGAQSTQQWQRPSTLLRCCCVWGFPAQRGTEVPGEQAKTGKVSQSKDHQTGHGSKLSLLAITIAALLPWGQTLQMLRVGTRAPSEGS